ncbi:hypothetical protein KCU62_g97, partial [Aureobasidium sp. EXF-3399]
MEAKMLRKEMVRLRKNKSQNNNRQLLAFLDTKNALALRHFKATQDVEKDGERRWHDSSSTFDELRLQTHLTVSTICCPRNKQRRCSRKERGHRSALCRGFEWACLRWEEQAMYIARPVIRTPAAIRSHISSSSACTQQSPAWALSLLLILIVLVLEVVLIKVLEALLELQSLTSEPVDGTGNELLLDVLTELVVELELGLNIVLNLLVVLGRGAGGVEEVEERGSGDGLLDNAGLLGV